MHRGSGSSAPPQPPNICRRATRNERPGAPPTSSAPGSRRRSPPTSTVPRRARDFLVSATPGAGKTTFALRLASELLQRRIDRPRHRRRPHRASQAAVGRRRPPRRHPARPALQQPARARVPPVPRGRRHLRPGGRPGSPAPRADDLGPHARHPRRGAPRRRHAQLGRRDPRGVRGRDPATLAHRDAVSQRHRAHPVRALPARRAWHPDVADRLRLQLRSRAARRRRAPGAVPQLRGLDALAHEAGRGV